MVMWTIADSLVIQARNTAPELKHEWLADARRFGWNFLAAFIGRGLRDHLGGSALTPAAETVGTGIELGFYRLLSAGGGFTLEAPDKTVDYSKTPVSARYAFTFWAFPRAAYVKNLQDYVQWADQYYKRTGFRCNMPLGSYFIRQDTRSLLSYTHDGDIISLDPIHAVGESESGGVGRLPQGVQRVGASTRRDPAAESEPVRQESARRRRVRRSLDEAGRLAADRRSEPADGERVLRRAAAVARP